MSNEANFDRPRWLAIKAVQPDSDSTTLTIEWTDGTCSTIDIPLLIVKSGVRELADPEIQATVSVNRDGRSVRWRINNDLTRVVGANRLWCMAYDAPDVENPLIRAARWIAHDCAEPTGSLETAFEPLEEAFKLGRLPARGVANDGRIGEVPVKEWHHLELDPIERCARDPEGRKVWTCIDVHLEDVYGLWPPAGQDSAESASASQCSEPKAVDQQGGGLGATPTPQQPARFSQEELRRWYQNWIKDHTTAGTRPSRDDDWIAAKEQVSRSVPRAPVRSLRNVVSPEDWQKGGRRRQIGGS